MRRRLLLPIAVLLAAATARAGADFSLEQTSHLFPYEGFEDRIEFWKRMFTRYGERQVVFHDRGDILLIYDVVRFEKGVEGDDSQRRRQRKMLKRRQRELSRTLDELRRWGAGSSRLSPRHHRIKEAIEGRGHTLTPALLRRLSRDLRYQRGIREKFRRRLIRSGRYLEAMEQVFRERDLPPELALLPHVESSFDYQAYSKRGAAGIWQFMRGTGRQYLKINRYLDERLDPMESTRAAARLLADNYRKLGNWPLAITAFNHGRNGMLRARRRHGSDLLTIVRDYRSRLFGFASKNFYAEFLAALEVTRNAEHHFGPLTPDSPLRYDTVRVPRTTRLAHLASEGISEELLRRYNPQVRNGGGVVPGGARLRVPAGQAEAVALALRQAPPARGEVRQAADGSLLYTVAAGDTLSGIARKFGTSEAQLQRANRINNRHRIYQGQKLVVGGPVRPERYRVRRGDTLIEIARRFGVSLSRLLHLNHIDNPNRIYLGQTLLIP